MILAAMYAEQQENSNHLLPPKCNSLMLYTPKLQYFKLATIHVMLKNIWTIVRNLRKVYSGLKHHSNKGTEDSVIDCRKEKTPSWKYVFCVADASLEREKLYYAKKKVKWEAEPHGHSLEAVANFCSKLLPEDPYYIFQLSDRNTNGKQH